MFWVCEQSLTAHCGSATVTARCCGGPTPSGSLRGLLQRQAQHAQQHQWPCQCSSSCRTRAEPHTSLLPILRAAVLQPKAKGKAKTGIKLSGTHMRRGQENAVTGVCEGMLAQGFCCSTAAGGTWLLMQAFHPVTAAPAPSAQCAASPCVRCPPVHVLTHGYMS